MTALDTVKAFNELLWNHFLMYALLGVGIFYTVYLGFPQIRHLNLAFKYAFGSVFKKKKPGENKVSSFQALATAVAAQVGTGNIGGVATAIAMLVLILGLIPITLPAWMYPEWHQARRARKRFSTTSRPWTERDRARRRSKHRIPGDDA